MKKLVAGCCVAVVILSCMTGYALRKINAMNEKISKLEQKSEKTEADFNKRFNDLSRDLNLETERLTLTLRCDSAIYHLEKLYETACLEIHFLPPTFEEDPGKNKKREERSKELDAILDNIKFIIEVFQGVKVSLTVLPNLMPILKNTVDAFEEESEKCRERLKKYEEKYRPQK